MRGSARRAGPVNGHNAGIRRPVRVFRRLRAAHGRTQVVLLVRWVLPRRPIVEPDYNGVHMPSIACDLP